MIGIRIANGEFFPVAGEGGAQTKRLVLTTVKDDQTSVHIDLYRSPDIDFKDATYLGSIVVDGIPSRPKQIPDIELVVEVSEDGSLHAVATDRESGRSKSLDAAVRRGEEGRESFDVPDFEITPHGLISDEEEPVEEPARPRYEPSLTMMREADDEPAPQAGGRGGRRGLSGAAIALIIVGAILLLAILGYFAAWIITGRAPFFGGEGRPVGVASPEPSPEPSPTPTPTPEPSPVPSPEPSAAAAAEKNGSKGVVHKIRWGDTLWHISIRYYGTPWLYPKIAKANKIKNPDRIISGRTLWIPPR